MRTRWFAAAALVFVAATRWALAPPRLHSFDSANFAIALDDFDPAQHQPQPPGYILFVAVARFMRFFFPSPELALIAAGIAGACAAVLLLGSLGAAMFGERAGLLAMALLASDPVMWFGGLTNPVRVFLAFVSTLTALAAWRALERPEVRGRLYAACAALGFAAGFRPETLLVLSPLLLYAWWKTGGGARRLAGCAAAGALAAAPWLAATAFAVRRQGGLALIFSTYAEWQFRDSSALFGAPVPAAAHMAAMALVWNFLGAAAWLWALPAALRDRPLWKGRTVFLGAWFLPPFLFSALIHIGDPDHALASIPALAVAGGAVLARFRPALPLAAAAMVVNAALFFFPTFELHRSASYKPVADIGRSNQAVLAEIERLRGPGPVTIVSYGGPVTFRHLSYYFPDDYVAAFPGTPDRPEPNHPMLIFHHRRPLPIEGLAGRLHPAAGRIVCIGPPGFRPGEEKEWRTSGATHYRDGVGAAEIRIGPHRLLPSR